MTTTDTLDVEMRVAQLVYESLAAFHRECRPLRDLTPGLLVECVSRLCPGAPRALIELRVERLFVAIFQPLGVDEIERALAVGGLTASEAADLRRFADSCAPTSSARLQ